MSEKDAQAAMREARAIKEEAASLLTRLISCRSTLGNETEAQRVAMETLREMGLDPRLSPIPASLKKDPEYSFSDEDQVYDGSRGNVLCRFPSGGEGRSLILQTHLDVVPAEEDWKEAFTASREGDIVKGRGACDALGQVVTLLMAMRVLQRMDVELGGDLLLQLVIEEEVGGNGALAAIREGHKADAVIVLEPTELKIHPANRGAIWFRLTVTGKSVHMGRIREGVSAIEKSMDVVRLLRAYERTLIEESRGVPLFETYEQPVQLNVGTIRGGIYPSMVPSECVMEGGVGFLPNKSMSEIKTELERTVAASEDPWIGEHFQLEFPKLHNDSYQTDPNHPAVRNLADAAKICGLTPEVLGWNVSCDARLYARLGGMPTMVFGAGAISNAHSTGEYVDLSEICAAAGVLATAVSRWCR